MTSPAPSVSVIMATYNGAETIRASIDSILSQTRRDIELVVADDGSSDGTRDILASITDPRLVVLLNAQNMGVVATRNKCLAHARGGLVALLDHDDLSAPTRLQKQAAFLDAHPQTVLVGTAAHAMDGGVLSAMNHPDVTTPGLIRWLLHVANPLICSSVMFRAAAVHDLGEFMRPDYTYADDFDFYHRMSSRGEIARLDEPLTIYRLHEGNAYKRYEDVMTANAVRVLEPAYARLFGAGASRAAWLVLQHLASGRPVRDAATLTELSGIFERLTEAFCGPDVDTETQTAIRRHAGLIWQRLLRATARHGRVSMAALLAARPGEIRLGGPGLARLALAGAPWRKTTRRVLDVFKARTPARPGAAAPVQTGYLFDRPYTPVPVNPDQPPTLFVVVDTEAEFDWHEPFARGLTSVSAMRDIGRGQAVFDRYGLRPIYVVDYPVVTQPGASDGLRAILQRDGCEIGAHLHPWTTPPFEEDVSNRNSYPGNLDPAIEEKKLVVLKDAIADAFGIQPVFYKAGRYGFGPLTPEALMRHGFKVDLSVMAGADLRANGGPDFRRLRPTPYRIGGTDILSLPMTRAAIGLTPSLAGMGHTVHRWPGGTLLRAPSLLARLRLADTITLTPEGVTASEQIRLLKSLLAGGSRDFVLHYHSPSLSPGHTPYARDAAGVDELVRRIETVCRFFFEELGGLPGYPRDLLQLLAPSGR